MTDNGVTIRREPSTMIRTRAAFTATAVAIATIAFSASAQAGPSRGRHEHDAQSAVVYTLDDSNHGNPEGVAWDGRSFYVGATGDGTIYRGTLGDHTVHTFIPGAAGRASVGLKTFHEKLYVAGGPTGKIFVYDLRHPAVDPITLATGSGGFLNDLVVSGNGDVYVTDSLRATLWHVAADQVKPGGSVEPISLSPEIAYTTGAFNLNGIVATRGGRELLVVNSADGALYRIRLGRARDRTITRVDAPALVGGDGMILDEGQLAVVRGNPASVTLLRLGSQESSARIVDLVTDPTLRGPSTIAAARHRYLVVNADFGSGTRPFTLSGLPRSGLPRDPG
jgi:Cu-Zn family superoxide dismutase